MSHQQIKPTAVHSLKPFVIPLWFSVVKCFIVRLPAPCSLSLLSFNHSSRHYEIMRHCCTHTEELTSNTVKNIQRRFFSSLTRRGTCTHTQASVVKRRDSQSDRAITRKWLKPITYSPTCCHEGNGYD